MSDSTERAGWRYRRGLQLPLRVASAVLASALAVVAQRRGDQGHVVRTALAVGGIVLVMSWTTESIARTVSRKFRIRCGNWR